MKQKKIFLRYREMLLAAFFLLGFFLFFSFPQRIFAASSSSYSTADGFDPVTNSTSSNYSLCSGIVPFSTSGTSSSFSVSPQLNCFVPPSGSGGRRRAECGNALLEFSETCDDGNLADGDGCSMTCQIEETPVVPVVPVVPVEPEEPVEPETPIEPEIPVEPEAPIEPDTPLEPEEPVSPDQPEQPSEPPVEDFLPGLMFAVCGNGLLEIGESCDDGNRWNADGCNNLCEIVSLKPSAPGEPVQPVPTSPLGTAPTEPVVPSLIIPEEYVISIPRPTSGEKCITEDLSRLYFNSLPGGSGDYEISVRDANRSYPLRVTPTDPDYFSFYMETELPSGTYQISLQDKLDPEKTYQTTLRVRGGQQLQAPLILSINGENITQEQCLQYLFTRIDQPLITGETPREALVAIYSELLERTFIVSTDRLNDYSFLYPVQMVEFVNDILTIVAIYPDGNRSQEQHIEIEYAPGHSAAPIPFISSSNSFFTFLATSFLIFVSIVVSVTFVAIFWPTSLPSFWIGFRYAVGRKAPWRKFTWKL